MKGKKGKIENIRGAGLLLLDLNIRGRAMSRGRQAACRNWKSPGTKFFHGVSRKEFSLVETDFNPMRPMSDF